MGRSETRAAVKIEQAIALVESVQGSHSGGVVKLTKEMREEAVEIRNRLRKIMCFLDCSKRREHLVHYSHSGMTLCGIRLRALPAGDSWVMSSQAPITSVELCEACSDEVII